MGIPTTRCRGTVRSSDATALLAGASAMVASLILDAIERNNGVFLASNAFVERAWIADRACRPSGCGLRPVT